jgi:hypothetical protein
VTAGLALGARCPACFRAARRRASRIGRWAAVGTSLPLAGYVTLTLPPDRTARLVVAAAVVLWYGLTFLIARRVAMEWLT